MIDVITLISLILGIIILKYGSKKQNKILRSIGIFVIIICLIYIIPSVLSGAIDGFIDGAKSGSFY